MIKTKLFIDGNFVSREQSFIETLTPGVLNARGVFETMRVTRGHVFAMPLHMERFRRGLKRLGIRPPYSLKKINAICLKSLEHAGLKEGRMRLMVWQEDNKVRCAVMVLPSRPIALEARKKGFKVMLLATDQKGGAGHSSVKSLRYQRFREAFLAAQKKKFDEAVLINADGYISEGSRTNIFIVKKGKIYTPSLQTGCLNGITRQIVIGLCRHVQLKVIPSHLTVRDILDADEVFLTNSNLGIMPVQSVQRKRITGNPGPITWHLWNLYQNLVL